jgi:hypothetical protein
MDSVTKMSATCKSCGSLLNINHTGPCPKCGQTGKIGKVEINEQLNITGSLDVERRREFYETNKKYRNIVIGITLVSSCLGFFLTGFIGLLAGLVLGTLSYFLSPYAVTKIRQIDKWHFK